MLIFSNCCEIFSPAMSRQNPPVRSRNLWQEGWTHRGMIGQTRARLNLLTGKLQVRDGGKWIECKAECVEFFTPKYYSSPD
jgi:hypothetical protein